MNTSSELSNKNFADDECLILYPFHLKQHEIRTFGSGRGNCPLREYFVFCLLERSYFIFFCVTNFCELLLNLVFFFYISHNPQFPQTINPMYIQRTLSKTHFVNGSWKLDLAAQTKIIDDVIYKDFRLCRFQPVSQNKN